MNDDHFDIATPPDLKGRSNETMPVRKQHPVYVDLLSPCNNACPAGEDILAWLWNEIRKAWNFIYGITYERLENAGLQLPCTDMDHPGTNILQYHHFPFLGW
jgi:hypothetical protein